jgi:transcriptional regulator with XRE-family HTH domain
MVSQWESDLKEELKDPQFAKAYGSSLAKSSFGIVLLKTRQEEKITQQELAEKLGTSQPYIAKLESGEANPTIGTAGSMMAVLGKRLVFDSEPIISDIAISSGSTVSTAFVLPSQLRKWVLGGATTIDGLDSLGTTGTDKQREPVAAGAA